LHFGILKKKKKTHNRFPRCLGGALVFELNQKYIVYKRRKGGAICVPRDDQARK